MINKEWLSKLKNLSKAIENLVELYECIIFLDDLPNCRCTIYPDLGLQKEVCTPSRESVDKILSKFIKEPVTYPLIVPIVDLEKLFFLQGKSELETSDDEEK